MLLLVKWVFGVGKVMEGKLVELGIVIVGDLCVLLLEVLEMCFGSFGVSLYWCVCGIDECLVELD